MPDVIRQLRRILAAGTCLLALLAARERPMGHTVLENFSLAMAGCFALALAIAAFTAAPVSATLLALAAGALGLIGSLGAGLGGWEWARWGLLASGVLAAAAVVHPGRTRPVPPTRRKVAP